MPGIIRLDDGTTIEIPEYDHDAVRDQYFAELTHPRTGHPYPDEFGATDDDIMAWLNGEGQEDDPDHLPYNPKHGF